MLGPLVIPAIMAGAQLAGQVFGAASQGSMNKKTRKWNEMMYDKQRKDALSDWQMQNEYNSPMQVMQRLRDANLNPNLVYGDGSAAQPAGVPRSVNMDAWHPEAPKVNFGAVGDTLMSYYDIQMKEAQLDNLKATNTVLQQDALLKTYQAAKEGTPLRMSENAEAGNLYESLTLNSLEAARANLDKTLKETSVLLSRNEREAAQSSSNIKEAAERILTLRLGRQEASERIKSLQKDNTLKDLDIRLRKQYNIGPGDPLWTRLLAVVLEKVGITP